jgi:hypothetical protein
MKRRAGFPLKWENSIEESDKVKYYAQCRLTHSPFVRGDAESSGVKNSTNESDQRTNQIPENFRK